MKDVHDIYRCYDAALEYFNKIGAPQFHFRDESVGKLSALSVSTEICHQQSSGSQNYWTEKNFDWALSEVVRMRFTELANEALKYLKQKADAEMVAEKEALKNRLALIESIEKEAHAKE